MTSSFGRWISKTPAEEPSKPAKPPGDCMVDGCPLPGVYRQSNDASLCCVHDGEDAHQWPAQTERIHGRFKLFTTALLMTNSLSGETPSDRLVDRVREMGGSPPRPIDGRRMTVRNYGAQIRSELLAECKGPRDIPQEARKAMDTWQKLTAPIA